MTHYHYQLFFRHILFTQVARKDTNTQDEFSRQNVRERQEGGESPDDRRGHPEVEGDRGDACEETGFPGEED